MMAQPKPTQGAKDDSDSIFIRNLSYDSDEASLKAFIEESFGKTIYCLICRNKETGDSRGSGFAKFENPEDAAKCLREFKDPEMQTKFHLDGRNIIVLPVIPKDKVDEVKQNREQETLKKERQKRRRRMIKERVLAKQRNPKPAYPTTQEKKQKKEKKKKLFMKERRAADGERRNIRNKQKVRT